MTEWDRLAPLIQEALDIDPTDTIDGIKAAVEAKELDFWPGHNTAAIGQIVKHPLRTDYHLWLAAGDLAEAITAFESVKAYAKAMGCNRVTLFGRRGFLKALGMSETFTGMAVDL